MALKSNQLPVPVLPHPYYLVRNYSINHKPNARQMLVLVVAARFVISSQTPEKYSTKKSFFFFNPLGMKSFNVHWRHREKYTAHYIQWIFPPLFWRHLIVSISLPWHAGLVLWMFWLDLSWSQPVTDADRRFHPPTTPLFCTSTEQFKGFHLWETHKAPELLWNHISSVIKEGRSAQVCVDPWELFSLNTCQLLNAHFSLGQKWTLLWFWSSL